MQSWDFFEIWEHCWTCNIYSSGTHLCPFQPLQPMLVIFHEEYYSILKLLREWYGYKLIIDDFLFHFCISLDDVVYMESSKLRDEYVQNDVGKVWQGSWRRYSGKHWVFGQFDDTVLLASCFILQQCMRENDRGNAVKVARAISKMVRFKLYKILKSSV